MSYFACNIYDLKRKCSKSKPKKCNKHKELIFFLYSIMWKMDLISLVRNVSFIISLVISSRKKITYSLMGKFHSQRIIIE